MAYKNKTHKINFALDDDDFLHLERLTCQGYFSYAEVFRQLLRSSNSDFFVGLLSIFKELKDIHLDLYKIVKEDKKYHGIR